MSSAPLDNINQHSFIENNFNPGIISDKWSQISAIKPSPHITLGDDSIQIGNLKMSYNEFEQCLRHLLEITKAAKPEEFI